MQYQNFSVQLKFSLTTTNDRYNFACLPAQFVVAPKSELVSLLFFFRRGGGWRRAGYSITISLGNTPVFYNSVSLLHLTI